MDTFEKELGETFTLFETVIKCGSQFELWFHKKVKLEFTNNNSLQSREYSYRRTEKKIPGVGGLGNFWNFITKLQLFLWNEHDLCNLNDINISMQLKNHLKTAKNIFRN